MKQIPFSPPDIGENEINEVTEALKSGWITTGARTKLFEKRIAEYMGTSKAVCLNSDTAALEMTLRILGIGAGDEVITSAYTYTATAAVIEHVGAKIVLVDTEPDCLEINYEQIEKAITEKTKAIIPIDIGGIICDYDKIIKIAENKKRLFTANNEIQKLFDRVIIIADSAHGFGAKRNGIMSGNFADFTCFSFHAVKNLTTGEGGAVTWKDVSGLDDDKLYHEYMLYSLHGQSKDAFSKNQLGAWEYDIAMPGYKCNMTDIQAAIGLKQLDRYDELLERRRKLVILYNERLANLPIEHLNHISNSIESSCHLYICNITGADEELRNRVIIEMAKRGVATNVHYKPLPMFTAYKNLDFEIDGYPLAFEHYRNEITLPLHTKLTNNDVVYICNSMEESLKEVGII